MTLCCISTSGVLRVQLLIENFDSLAWMARVGYAHMQLKTLLSLLKLKKNCSQEAKGFSKSKV